MKILFSFPVVVILVIMMVIAVQVFLSMQRNKWLGLIIPIISLLISVISIVYAFSAGAVNAAIAGFLVMSIPTVVNLAIYFACRTRLGKKNYDEITKMKIDDLE